MKWLGSVPMPWDVVVRPRAIPSQERPVMKPESKPSFSSMASTLAILPVAGIVLSLGVLPLACASGEMVGNMNSNTGSGNSSGNTTGSGNRTGSGTGSGNGGTTGSGGSTFTGNSTGNGGTTGGGGSTF